LLSENFDNEDIIISQEEQTNKMTKVHLILDFVKELREETIP